MYTKEENYDVNDHQVWDILDPDGDVIARGLSEDEADSLLSHLNR